MDSVPIVALLVSAHMNAYGSTPSSNKLAELFDLADRIVAMARQRDLASRVPMPEPTEGRSRG
jgi:hypothetical protein